MAKKIISFIYALGEMINNDPDVNGRLKVVYIEDYNVTMAEKLMPAADISEQISLAGTEASGTGNMKLMLNGAITLGTMDGANIEIHDAVGSDNIFIFGMKTPEVNELKRRGYNPMNYYNNNQELHNVIDFIAKNDIAGKRFPEIANIINNDPYMVLADFADYRRMQQYAERLPLELSLGKAIAEKLLHHRLGVRERLHTLPHVARRQNTHFTAQHAAPAAVVRHRDDGR